MTTKKATLFSIACMTSNRIVIFLNMYVSFLLLCLLKYSVRFRSWYKKTKIV